MSYIEKLSSIKAILLDLDGVLSDGGIYISETGAQLRKMNIKDGYAIQLAIKMKYLVAVISGGNSESVIPRLQGLGITELHLGVKDKRTCLQSLMEKYQLSKEHTLYIGDDIPDLNIMQEVGLACCPADASVEIKSISAYISDKNGGEGCVRDVIEKVMRAQDTWNNEFSTLTRAI